MQPTVAENFPLCQHKLVDFLRMLSYNKFIKQTEEPHELIEKSILLKKTG